MSESYDPGMTRLALHVLMASQDSNEELRVRTVKRPRATCHICDREVAIRKDGTLHRHLFDGTKYSRTCQGSGTREYTRLPTLPLFDSGRPELAEEISREFGEGSHGMAG